MRKHKKRLDFIIDVMKDQKHLTSEEIIDLKEKRDEFTISKKLKVYYEFPIGDGAASTVYLGFLIGPSPLNLATKRIETQHFQDCKVAVKDPSSFGYDESEQLFNEIESMKKIGYHEHIIIMLCICFLDKNPVMVVELASNDLLKYVNNFRENIMDHTYFPFKIFFSILWQVARGTFVIDDFIDLTQKSVL
uniref:Protein kinase domain-containing protein n=1 Tax=Acrobeloides nanus TaxID=290746 RepID=A0A914D5R1_9BILA